jgi:endo-1,4-beta-xylanase
MPVDQIKSNMLRKLYLFIILTFSILSVCAQLQQSLSYYADKCAGLKIGAAVGYQFYNEYDTGSIYDKIVKNNFNILVAENEMKYDAIEPTKGVFNFSKADILTNYAQKYGKQVRGHTLCWHNQLPAWLNAGLTNGTANATFTRSSLLVALKNHITTIVGRYKGKVQQWDVVNEPFTDSNGALRNSIWQQVIGNDYIDSAFVWAHAADPQAKLYLNEYGAELYGSTKANALYNYILTLKNKGIPVTGVGLQCHFTVSAININKLDQNIKRYAEAGLEAIITELDIRIPVASYNVDSAKMLANQASDYLSMIRVALNNPNVKTFVTWGFTDKYSWIPSFTATNGPASDYSLLFDKSFLPKPAYTSILTELAAVAQSTSIGDLKQIPDLRCTLAGNEVEVQTDEPIDNYSLVDIYGRIHLIQTVKCSNGFSIPVDRKIQKGIFMIVFQTKSGLSITKKIML